MDETQKILIKAGRKDLAQKYYEKVAVKSSGAEKVFENDKVEVYHILNREAAKKYGAGAQWGLDGDYFQYLYAKNNIYFVLSKYKTKEDPLFKMVIVLNEKGTTTVHDARNEVIKMNVLRAEGIPVERFGWLKKLFNRGE